MRSSLISLCLGLTVAACGTPFVDEAPSENPPNPPQPQDPPRARILGMVVDLSRQPIVGASVKLCNDTCRDFVSDATGGFAIADVTAGNYALHVEQRGAMATEYGKVVIPLYAFDPVQTPARALPPIVLPKLGATTVLGSGKQTVAIDPMLSLTVDNAALQFPMGTGTPRLAGVRVPQQLYPDFCLPGGDGRILAEWALGPFATTSSASIELHIGDGLGLVPGTSVNLMTIDPDLGRPERQGVGMVSADGQSIDSQMTMGVRRLTWLIISMPGGGA